MFSYFNLVVTYRIMGYCPTISSVGSTVFLILYIKYLGFGSFFQGIAVAQEIIKMTELDSDMSAFSTSM